MVTLYLLSEKGHSVLEGLISAGYSNFIASVVVGKDSAVENDFSDGIITLAQNHGIKWCYRGYDASCSLGLAISWRWMITENQCTSLYVIHDSLLPKYRGFSPLVSQLVNGEESIGATLLEASEKYDEGNIVYKKSISVVYPCTIQRAITMVAGVYVDLSRKLFDALDKGSILPSFPQKHDEATYSLWRDDLDYQINWLDSASTIERFIDAVGFPYRGSRARLADKIVVIEDAKALPDVHIENRAPGKVIFVSGGFPVVVCGEGLLEIKSMRDDNNESLLPISGFRLRFH